MIVCAGYGEDFAFAKSIGMGLVESAMRLSLACSRESVDSIVFIGSAGSYDKSVEILSLQLCDNATQLDLGFLQGQAYTPMDNRIQSGVLDILNYKEAFQVSCETKADTHLDMLFNLPQATTNSSNYITTDEKLSKLFMRAGVGLENMEFFAVMRVAQYFQIPCVGIFCVSNYCHTQAHEEYIAYRNQVRERLNNTLPIIRKLESLLILSGEKMRGNTNEYRQ